MVLKKILKKQRKAVVLGLDGVPCSLLQRFMDEGVMPHLANYVDGGTLIPMTASIPEVSSTSWSTFMTGVNPGRHGIYGFMDLDRETYAWKFPNFSDLKSGTIWDMAGQKGFESIVLNIPSTYPARPMNGRMASGFVALDFDKAVYPADFGQYLKEAGYRLDVDSRKAASDMDAFVEDIKQTFSKRTEIIHHLYDSGNWDLFIAAITATDRLHHYLWEALDDRSHPRHDFFMDFYVQLDRFIGSLSSKVGDRIPFLVISDHGFTTIRKEIYLNAFLREKGYLRFRSDEPRSFEDMDESSRVFALDPSRIYIHRTGLYRNGKVTDDEYEALRNRVAEDLLALEVDGEKVIRTVFRKEEVYEGSCFENAPDLVVLPKDGFDLKGSPAKVEISGRSLLTGGHTRDDAVFFVNRKVAVDSINIVDVGVTVLDLLGIDTGSLDGTSVMTP